MASQSDEEINAEFEREAEQAFQNVVKGARKREDDDEFQVDDEFDEAFNSVEYDARRAGNEENGAGLAKQQQSDAKNDGSEIWPNKNSSEMLENVDSGQGTDHEVFDEKENAGENIEMKSDVPPLPEFALDLITRKLSQGGDAMSPSHSGHSSESSERGWSSDPDMHRTKPKKTLDEVREEWNQVETVTAGTNSQVAKSPMVSFSEAMFHFKNANMDEYAASIKPTIKHKGLSAIWHAVTGPPRLVERLRKDRDLIFTLGLCPLDNLEAMHIMVLQTIYKKLTATNLDCPRYGAHWESIGFQGEDPSTDLRGCGMLGLLTTLSFVTSPSTASLAIDVYRLSEDEVQNFPFCVMGINITRIAIQIFREGKLNKECNSRGQVFEVFNELYCAIYHRIYRIWKTQHKTISDSGFVIHEVETAAKKNPILFMRDFQKTMSERKKAKAPTVAAEPTSKQRTLDKVDKFAGICDLGTDEQVDVHLV